MKAPFEISQVVKKYWGVGNKWTRGPLIWLALHMFLITVVSLLGIKLLTELYTFFPIFLFLILLLASPVLTIGLLEVKQTRRGLGWVALIVMIEVAYGMYLTAVSLRNDPALSLLPLLALFLALPIVFDNPRKSVRAIAFLGAIAFCALTVVFLLGGRQKVDETVSGWFKPDTTAAVRPLSQAGLIPPVPQVAPPPAPIIPQEQVIEGDSGQIVKAAWVGDGVNYLADANYSWQSLSGQGLSDTSHVVNDASAGQSTWYGHSLPGKPYDKWWMRFTHNGTRIKLTRIP